MTKKLRITVEGKVYEVTVEVLDQGTPQAAAPVMAAPAAATAAAPAPVQASAAAPAKAAAPSAGAGDLASPLSGKVVSVDTNVGADVKEGDKLITLEAMKMNTFVQATASGKVTAIHVAAGDAVDEGQSLLSIG